MRKVFLILISIVLAMSFVSCEKTNKWGGGGGGGGGMSSSVNKPSQNKRTVDISEGILNEGQKYEYSYDFDSDNQVESISMYITEEDEDYRTYLKVSVGEKTKTLDIFEGSIDKVYFCDIDTLDNAGDIAIITTEYSGDPRIRILSYGNNLKAYNFVSDYRYSESNEITDDNGLGYACNFYFNVNNDDTITLEEQTTSYGMWSVYKNYKRNQDGNFEEIRPEKYEILADFMADRDLTLWEDLSEEEADMWKRGYVQAKIPWNYGDVELEEGEYFKPIYDDGNNNIYIETKNGESGWLEIKHDRDARCEELNPLFFFLAG